MKVEPVSSRYPSVQQLIAEGRPGICPLCDEPLPPRRTKTGRLRVHCGAAECLRLYHVLVNRDRRAAHVFVRLNHLTDEQLKGFTPLKGRLQ